MKTKAAVLYEMGKSKPYAESKPLVIEELELEGPGAGEVLVEIGGAGLCHSDLSVINGSRPRIMPMALGHEAAGTVREVGSGVTELKEGDHVVFSFVPVCGHCQPCQAGRAALCEPGFEANVAGALLNGSKRFRNAAGQTINHHQSVSGYSQFTVSMPQSLVRIDPDVPLETAVLFGCAIMTGVGAVVNTAQVMPGSSVAVFGMGGVGLSAVMGAKAAGAGPIIAVDKLEAKLDLARKCGATHTINASINDPIEAIRDLTRGGVEYSFEVVGSEKVLAQAYAATGRGGTTVSVGLPHPEKKLEIQAVSLTAEERVLRGSYMGSCVPSRDIPRFIRMYQAGLLPVDLLKSKNIALEEVNESFDALDRGEVVRQVIRFN
jgi:alcohol dehydrogenase